MQFGEGYTVFCDEVRREANGKDFYIGVYTGGDYIIHKKPEDFQAPQFTVIATAMFDPTDPPDKDKTLQIFFPGQDEPVIDFEFEIPEQAFNKVSAADEASTFPHAPLVARSVITVSDVRFKESGFVRAIMQYGDEQFLLGRLKITFKEPVPTVDNESLEKLVGG